MAELREVFDMVTKQTEPDLDSWRQQEERQRKATRNRRLRAFAVVAALVAVGTLAIVKASSGTTTRPAKKVSPSSPHPLLPGVSAQTSEIVDLGGRHVATIPGFPVDAFSLSMSADGRRASFVTDPDGAGWLNQVAVISVDGTGMRVLRTGGLDVGSTAMSPDGSKVAFEATTVADGNTDIYLIGVDGSGLRRLTTDPSMDQFPQWSPDGSTIAYDNAGTARPPNNDPQYSRTANIWSVPADGGTPTRLTTTPGPENAPAFSPDGARIAYFHDGDVWVMDANGTHQAILVNQGGEGGFTPRWSPDGRRIAFTVYDARYRPEIAQSGTYRDAPLVTLVVYDLRTDTRTDLSKVAMATDYNVPVWLPSSDRLLIRSVPPRAP